MANEDRSIQADNCQSWSAGNSNGLGVEFGEFQSISDRANRLLSRERDFDVIFKRSICGLESDDFVSLANSAAGGAILIGVRRISQGKGRRRSALVGCAVGEREKLKILAKSNQCVPPVPVSIFVEDCLGKPFYRIEIPSGRHKPYCTLEGTYTIRGAGRNEMLYPAQLQALFREAEDREFVRWFQPGTTSGGFAGHEAKPLNGGAADAGAFLETGAESNVRLSSQDLCGFLMRLP